MNEFLDELKNLVEINCPNLKCLVTSNLLGISGTKSGLPISIGKNKETNGYRICYAKEVVECSHYGLGRWCKSNFEYDFACLSDRIEVAWLQLKEAIDHSDFERKIWDSWSVNEMEEY